MALEQLYDLAFQYKKTKLWERIQESQIFAVKLSDGRTGYISVMASNGEYHAMNLYIGKGGFRTLRTRWKAAGFMIFDLDYQEYLLGQDCLQCAFEKKDGMSLEECEEVKAYTRSHGIRLGGKYTYPKFLKLQPYCIPWYLQPQEEDCLRQGLAAAVEMARLLDETGPDALHLEEFHGETKEIPMLEQKNGKFILQMTEIPEDEPEIWPVPKRYNDIAMANLKKMKKRESGNVRSYGCRLRFRIIRKMCRLFLYFFWRLRPVPGVFCL